MGLGITGYSWLELIDMCDQEEYDLKYVTGPDHGTFHAYEGYVSRADFPARIEGANLKPDGVYRYAERYSFEAGAYSTYNRWRSWLSMSFIGATPREIWTSPTDAYRTQPFYELVNFSDCEGLIAGPTATKLFEDFTKYAEMVRTMPASKEWFYERYTDFWSALAFAANDGVVSFH